LSAGTPVGGILDVVQNAAMSPGLMSLEAMNSSTSLRRAYWRTARYRSTLEAHSARLAAQYLMW